MADKHEGLSMLQAQSLWWLLGDKAAAREAGLALYQQQELFGKLTRPGVRHCLDFQAGKCSATELEKSVTGSQWDQCLAHFLIGMSELADGNRPAAARHFQLAVDTKAYFWTSHDLSWLFLKRIEADPTWPPWIPSK
jgi:hypothetical protein